MSDAITIFDILDLRGVFWSALFTTFAVILTWKIAELYHQRRKSKSDLHFEEERERALESIKHRTGQSYSILKTDCAPLLKKQIYEQDLIAFASAYENKIKAITHNSENLEKNESYYMRYLDRDEYEHHLFFFHKMIRFLRSATSGIEKENPKMMNDIVGEKLERVNQELEEIKLQAPEYEGTSHIITANAYISEHVTHRLELHKKGIKNYKCACPFY